MTGSANLIPTALLLVMLAGGLLWSRRAERQRGRRQEALHQRIEDERHAHAVMRDVVMHAEHHDYCWGWARRMFGRGDYAYSARYSQAALVDAQELGDPEAAAADARLLVDARRAEEHKRRVALQEECDWLLEQARDEEYDHGLCRYAASEALGAARRARDPQRVRVARRAVRELEWRDP